MDKLLSQEKITVWERKQIEKKGTECQSSILSGDREHEFIMALYRDTF